MTDSLNFLKPYLRGWPIIIASMVIAFMAASKYLNYVTPMYESTAKLRMADLNEGVPNSNLFKDLDVFATAQKINAEIELLKSHALITKALGKVPFEVQIFRAGSIRKTELFNDCPVLITPINWEESMRDQTFQLNLKANRTFEITAANGRIYDGQLGDTIQIEGSTIAFLLNEPLLAKKPNLQVADKYTFAVLSMGQQIAQVASQLDIISVDKDVPVIRISYKSSHPEKAAMLPNALAEAYIEDYIENKYGAANVTVNFLNERIEEMSEKLAQSEEMILNYRDVNGITNISQETETDLRKISQLKIQQTNLKMSVEAIKDLETYVQSGKDNFLELAPNFEAFTDLLSTEIIKNIKQLQAEKKDLLLQYTPQNDRVLVVDAKIKDLTSYLVESITNTRKNLETKYNKLTNDIEEAEKTFITVPEKERVMKILNREFEIYQQSYNFLNQKKIEAEIAKAAKIAFHRIITPAFKSKEPVSPNRIIIKIVAVMLGMMGAMIFIFIIHRLKARVNDLSTVEASSMIPIIAAVPKLKNEQEQESFFIKTVAHWDVKGLLPAGGLLCLSSYDPQHGASFIAQQLVKTLSNQQRKLLVVRMYAGDNRPNADFWNLKTLSPFIDELEVATAGLKTLSIQQWQAFLQEKSQGYDLTVMLNTAFGASHSMASMAVAQLNLVVLDTRLTPASLVPEVDLMQAEFKLPNMYFAINRAGYSPSLIKEIRQFLSSIYAYLLTKSAK